MIDTMGYPTVLPLFKLIGGSKVGCYVHYPTISTDMISLVEKRHTTYNNSGWISESSVFSFIKLWYYKIFALYYRFCGYTTDVVMVNGSWTESHVRSLWKREVAKVFPPCDTTKFLELVNSSEALLEEKKIVQVLSIGQIRPEKNHKLQLDAFNLAREKLNDSSIHLKLVIAGGCRHEDDIARAQDLKDYANKLGIEENVEWKLNCPFNELLACMSESLIGIHSMWNEHFGISVVEQIAGGNVMISHNSGGPMMDIVVDAHPATDSKGFLCETVEEYAEAIVRVINLSKQERHGIVIRAKEQSTRVEMKVFSILIFHKNEPDNKVKLMKTEMDLSSFGLFQRNTVRDFMQFTSKLFIERSTIPSRSSVKEQEYWCHAYVRSDGLSGVCITDDEYQQRVAFTMLSKVLEDFLSHVPESKWATVTKTDDCKYEGLKAHLTRWQNPSEADALTKVQEEVEETKIVLHETINSILTRGEKLDDIIKASEDLSEQSKMFFTTAKKMNKCCSWT
uniref:GDP-Man:Man(3)GlcNAc(2)-PP-Dol alpha-1,2-mannosyltransferase n=1 Tax=Rhabditophanes sp. KR3021 TaxID=114890 RepID=A0AC35TS78_9BILA